MFAKIQNNQVVEYPIANIRQLFPSVSFPEVIRQEHLPDGYVLVQNTQLPQFDPATHKAVPAAPVLAADQWVAAYDVEPLSETELQDRHSATASDVRQKRNDKLAESDWTQVADAPVDQAAWAAYRQALRDVTAQPGFPFAVTWPAAPM